MAGLGNYNTGSYSQIRIIQQQLKQLRMFISLSLNMLRTDTGGIASICDFLNYSPTRTAIILYYTPFER